MAKRVDYARLEAEAELALSDYRDLRENEPKYWRKRAARYVGRHRA